MPITQQDFLTRQGSGYDPSTENTTYAQNPIVQSQEVKGGIKLPGTTAQLEAYLNPSTGRYTLVSLSSIAYDTTDGEFKVFHDDVSTTAGWYPMSDYLGVSSLKIQLPGGSTGASTPATVTTDAGLLDVDRIRVGVKDASGIGVSLTNEIGESTVDTFRLFLINYSNFDEEYDAVNYNGDEFRVPMWDPGASPTASQGAMFRGSPISVTSNGTSSTVEISGDLNVVGALTQGSAVTATSLDVANRYIKSNDGYEAVAQNVAAAQGGFLVQVGVDDATTPAEYYQRGIFWDAVDGHWRKSNFTSTSTAESATYTEDNDANNVPILETATAAEMYFTTSGNAYDHYYATPATLFSYHNFGTVGSDYDIDGDAGVAISNQSMTLDGSAVTSESGATLIASTSGLTTNFSTHNKVRTARIISIRAIATDANATAKTLTIELPDSIGYNDILMISVYQINDGGTHTSHTRQELFGTELIDGADNSNDGVFQIALNQAGFSAGDVFDIVVVA